MSTTFLFYSFRRSCTVFNTVCSTLILLIIGRICFWSLSFHVEEALVSMTMQFKNERVDSFYFKHEFANLERTTEQRRRSCWKLQVLYWITLMLSRLYGKWSSVRHKFSLLSIMMMLYIYWGIQTLYWPYGNVEDCLIGFCKVSTLRWLTHFCTNGPIEWAREGFWVDRTWIYEVTEITFWWTEKWK